MSRICTWQEEDYPGEPNLITYTFKAQDFLRLVAVEKAEGKVGEIQSMRRMHPALGLKVEEIT